MEEAPGLPARHRQRPLHHLQRHHGRAAGARGAAPRLRAPVGLGHHPVLHRGGRCRGPHDGFPHRDEKLPGHGAGGAAAAAAGGSVPARVQQHQGRQDHLQQQPQHDRRGVLGPAAYPDSFFNTMHPVCAFTGTSSFLCSRRVCTPTGECASPVQLGGGGSRAHTHCFHVCQHKNSQVSLLLWTQSSELLCTRLFHLVLSA